MGNLRSRFHGIKRKWYLYSQTGELAGKSFKQKNLFFVRFLNDKLQDFMAGSFFSDVDELLRTQENVLLSKEKRYVIDLHMLEQ